jgi:flagellar FliL protein
MATTETAAETPAEGEAAPTRKPRGKLVVLLVVLVVGLGGAGGAAWLLLPRVLGRAAAPEKAEARPEPPVRATVPLGAVVVNIAGEGRRYLKVGVDVGVADARAVKKVEEHKPQMLDLTITVLSRKDAATLSAPEGRAALKDELLAGMRGLPGLDAVVRVYFTEFIIQ